MTRSTLTDNDYAKLLALRTGLRKFLRWSEPSAEILGITAVQHQLLLAVSGHDNKAGPTISELAGYLLSQHHSVSELVQRAIDSGLVQRYQEPTDRRIYRIRLAKKGEDALEMLSSTHLEELSRLASEMSSVWEGISFDSTKRFKSFSATQRS